MAGSRARDVAKGYFCSAILAWTPLAATVLVFLALTLTNVLGGSGLGMTTGATSASALRDHDPVTMAGSKFPEFRNIPLSDLAVYRFDPASASFLPIPFQIDERVDHVFNPGTPFQFSETMYDVFHEDDGLFDDLDEIAFMFSDAGPQAPLETVWPSAADPIRFEIRVTDPRPGSPAPPRWVYLYSGEGLPRSPVHYVDWNLSPSGSISTNVFILDYDDRWLLTGYSIATPCGNGVDIIDRVKGRAGLAPHIGETEELWNATSSFLGGIVGPVRAIRSVRGAASGVNTTHHDVVYGSTWLRRYNLRVHPVTRAWLYVDLLPRPGTVIFTPGDTEGLSVDGHPDSVGVTAIPDWSISRGPDGGMVILYDVPPSPLYGFSGFYYRDDSEYNDAPLSEPDYADEDDSAYGNHGFFLDDIRESNTNAITASFQAYPLCGNEGSAEMGNAYHNLEEYPLESAASVQWSVGGRVRNLLTRLEGNDILLDWEDVSGASGYRVYVSLFPDSPHSSWTPLADTSSSSHRDEGTGSTAQDCYYSVVSLTPSGEGPW
jgi:hypothetical protein